MSPADRVLVRLPDKSSFTGVITGIQGVSVIVKPDDWELWMKDYWKVALDPEHCLTVHQKYVTSI